MASSDRPVEGAATAKETEAWSDLRETVHCAEPRLVPGPELRPAAIVSHAEFVRALTGAGLIEHGDLAAFLPRDDRTAEAAALARDLIRAGRLTPYQAAAVLQGKAKGLSIGSYLVLDRIGAGGMGMVFKARHRRINRVVALKVLPPSVTKNQAAVLRFEREGQAVARLNHPNIVAALDAGEFNGLHFFVMDYVDGRDLARVVTEDGPLPVRRAVDLTLQAARGLGAAHARGVFHRDIKPPNLLLDPSGVLKISDLGIARVQNPADLLGGAASGQSELTRDGAIMGTVDFMPPEQAYNSRLADHRSDIYSLGCTLYYLLTGAVPFPGETLMSRLLAHREAPIPAPSALRGDVPPALDAVLLRMMAKPPEGRFQSMDELITDLEPCLATSPDSPAPPPAVAPSGRARPTVVMPARGRSKTVVEGEIVVPAPARIEPTVVLPAKGPAETIVEGALALPPAPADRPNPPRVSRKVVLVGAAVLGLTLAAVVVDVRRVRTGDLLVQSDRVDSRVTIKRHGRTVAGPTGSRSFTIAPGDYDVEVDGEPRGRVSVVRGERAVLRVTEPARPVPSNPAPTPDPAAAAAAPARPVEPPPPAPAERVGVVRAFRHGAIQSGAQAVAVSADGRRAVTAGNDHFVRVWELGGSAREVGRLPHDGPVFSVALSADGRRAASASGDRTARLWDLEARREVRRFSGHTKKVNSVDLSPGGGLVLTGSDDGSARLWDVDTGKPIATVRHDGPVNAVAFVPGSDLAFSAGDDATIRVWKTDGGGTTVGTMNAGGKVLCLTVSVDGGRVLAGSATGGITGWDVAGRTQLRKLEGGPRDWVCAVAFLPGGAHALAGYQGGKLLVWDVESGRPVHTFDEGPDGRLGLAVLGDGVHALSADADGQVRLWRLPPEVAPSAGAR